MKSLLLPKLLLGFFAVVMLISACKKEEDPVITPMTSYPEIEILSPSKDTVINFGESVNLQAKVTKATETYVLAFTIKRLDTNAVVLFYDENDQTANEKTFTRSWTNNIAGTVNLELTATITYKSSGILVGRTRRFKSN